jgi:hypothetical protein
VELDLSIPRRAVARENLARLAFPVATAGTIAAALVLRGRRALTLVDWPLNDGGMFYTIIEEIRRSAYTLPHVTSYNSAGIPFAYSPLAFYVAALTSDVLAVPTSEVLRFLPVLFSTLAVAAFVPLARALSPSPVAAAVAVFSMAVQPSAYTWMVMGGGLTRSLGLLFAILALFAFHTYYTRGGRGPFVAAAALTALTLLTHIEYAWFVAFSAALFLLAYGHPRRRATLGFAAIGACAVLVTSPWWVTVVARHGLAPFIAAATTGSLSNPVTDLLTFERTDEPYFPLVAAMGILGLVTSVLRRQFLIPAWLVAIALLDARSFNVLSALPLGLLAGVAATQVVAPLARDRRLLAGVAMAAILYTGFASGKASQELHRSIKADERAAMAWLKANTPPDARILVITEQFWAGDRVAEWLPALSERKSLVTVQGSEWFRGDRGFWSQMVRYDEAQQCGARDAACLATWEQAHGGFDYVYLPKSVIGYWFDGAPAWCCEALRAALNREPGYRAVFDGEGASIFARLR